MKMHLIYPKWPKLERQTSFNLPPHGPVVLAAATPQNVDINFSDDNVEEIVYDENTDIVAISTMLTSQLPRAFEIAKEYRKRNKKVIFGGIATMLHSEEVKEHCDAVFLGEAEGRIDEVLNDFKKNKLKPEYNYMNKTLEIKSVGTARRSILNYDFYQYRGIKMLDLVHASRGCKFNCFPCCVGFLGGKNFRARPIKKVIDEIESIDNDRLFFVDNSLAQDKDWLIELFTALKPLKKKWVSHPILDDEKILDLAQEAGCWYVYQAVFDTSDTIRNRIKRLQARGIGVEGTIILGMDNHDEDYIKRLIDFLMEIELDMAEFTILTPFPCSPIRKKFEKEGRIVNNNWLDYTCDKVVFKPKKISPEKLQELYYYAWDTFYQNGGQQLKMAKLFQKVIS